jgi:hypothetical protein
VKAFYYTMGYLVGLLSGAYLGPDTPAWMFVVAVVLIVVGSITGWIYRQRES